MSNTDGSTLVEVPLFALPLPDCGGVAGLGITSRVGVKGEGGAIEVSLGGGVGVPWEGRASECERSCMVVV
jgi:hypothetical protein